VGGHQQVRVLGEGPGQGLGTGLGVRGRLRVKG
jgi:hypothetical protein